MRKEIKLSSACMIRYAFHCLIAFFLFGCKPEKSTGEMETTKPLAEVADSVSNTRKDGTATASTPPLDIKQQLPSELEVYLDRTHSLWQFPVLTDTDVKRIPAEEQGPYFLEADFNGDKQKDFAIQLMERDSSFVYVFLKNKDDYQEYLLERSPLVDIDGKKRSIVYLRLAPKTGRYHDYATKKQFSIPQDAVSIGTENHTATYVWENGRFRKYETGD